MQSEQLIYVPPMAPPYNPTRVPVENPEMPAPPVSTTVYIREEVTWEYKVITRDLREAEILNAEELNKLGSQGWELTGVAQVQTVVQLYFKRQRTN
ncbi:DUF4177 domain-containing protein [Chloroflexi bacterium TSY]|nr:DUF4177 domain-containing protein [Chloroflexi bacterium TSY]